MSYSYSQAQVLDSFIGIYSSIEIPITLIKISQSMIVMQFEVV